MADALAREGWGSGASPLVTGHAALHRKLEERLAEFEGTEAALLFSSGFAANMGTIAALAGPGDVVFCDRKNHASLWDGCRLSRADVRVYPHGDCGGSGGRCLAPDRRHGQYRRRLIVTDSLFSMDGDLAPLGGIGRLAEAFDAMLLVDEAHATGVFGPRGRGVAEHLGVEDRVPVRIGTLSKALGSVGGFVAGSRPLVEWLVNRARPYVFSTAAPAAAAAAAIAALDIVRDEPQRREGLARPGRIIACRTRPPRLEHGRIGQPDHSADRGRSRAGGEPLVETARSRPVRPGDSPADRARRRGLSADQLDRRAYRGDDCGIVGGVTAVRPHFYPRGRFV